MSLNRVAVAVLAAGGVASGIAVGAVTKPTFRVNPSTVHRGQNVTFSGRHWGANKTVTLMLGYKNSEAAKIGTARTKGDGSFSQVRPILSGAPTGNYVVLACRKSCAIKVSRALKILP